jgi:hypothetical protein
MMKKGMADEIDMLMTQLIAAWGSVNLEGTGTKFIISDPMETVAFEAPTILEALRLAAASACPATQAGTVSESDRP